MIFPSTDTFLVSWLQTDITYDQGMHLSSCNPQPLNSFFQFKNYIVIRWVCWFVRIEAPDFHACFQKISKNSVAIQDLLRYPVNSSTISSKNHLTLHLNFATFIWIIVYYFISLWETFVISAVVKYKKDFEKTFLFALKELNVTGSIFLFFCCNVCQQTYYI